MLLSSSVEHIGPYLAHCHVCVGFLPTADGYILSKSKQLANMYMYMC